MTRRSLGQRIALALIGGIAAGALGACSSGSSSTPGPSTASQPGTSATPTVTATVAARPTPIAATVGDLKLTLPAGWTVSSKGNEGFVAASQNADLTADAPAGARLTVAAVKGGDVDLATGPKAAGTSLKVAEKPTATAVAGKKAATLGLRETRGGVDVRSRTVVVEAGGGRAYQFLFECPADKWDANAATFDGMLAGASISARP